MFLARSSVYSIPLQSLPSGLETTSSNNPAAPAIQTTPMNVCGIVAVFSPVTSPAKSPARRLPNEVPRNQIPMACPTSRGGANLVTALRPTGLRQSSPTVWRK